MWARRTGDGASQREVAPTCDEQAAHEGGADATVLAEGPAVREIGVFEGAAPAGQDRCGGTTATGQVPWWIRA